MLTALDIVLLLVIVIVGKLFFRPYRNREQR